MYIDFLNKRIKIEFSYERGHCRAEIKEVYVAPGKFEFRYITSGHAFCHDSDQFVKKTGRKIALKRALETWGISRELRREFYNELFNKGFKIA